MTRALAEMIAKQFHDAYTRLAPVFGHETPVPWDDLENNEREWRIATVIAVFTEYVPPPPPGLGVSEPGSR